MERYRIRRERETDKEREARLMASDTTKPFHTSLQDDSIIVYTCKLQYATHVKLPECTCLCVDNILITYFSKIQYYRV